MAATQIKVVGGEHVCVCVCVCGHEGWCLLPFAFPAVASAGAAGELDSMCACVSLKCFIRSSLQRQTGFNLHDVF